MSKWYVIGKNGEIIDEGGTPAPSIDFNKIMMNKLEKVITSYIPKHNTCRFEEQKRQMQRDAEKKEIVDRIEKVQNPASVVLDIDWAPQSPDMSVCRLCKETIFGTRYQLKIKINGEGIEQRRPVNLCEPCFFNL